MTEGGGKVSENCKRYVSQESQATAGSGAIDHIAFRVTGLREMMAHLKSLGVDFKQRQIDDQDLYQLFMFDPNGIKVELNYSNAEAVGLRAEVEASVLPG